MKITSLFILITLFHLTFSKCTYRVDDPDDIPVTLDDSND